MQLGQQDSPEVSQRPTHEGNLSCPLQERQDHLTMLHLLMGTHVLHYIGHQNLTTSDTTFDKL